MYSIFLKNITKIFSEFNKIAFLPKVIIKLGSIIFFVLFLVGIILFIINCMIKNYSPYFELIATSIIKSSFTILAEAIIGGLIIDYVFKK